MDLHLSDKVAIVTGGASGIGGAITKTLLAEGAKVLIASRLGQGEKKFIKSLVGFERQFLVIEIELGSTENCQQIVEFAKNKFGQIDILVHNAGINDGVRISDAPDKFMQSIQNNLSHIFSITHFAHSALVKSKGAIVMIGSKVSVTGQGSTNGYAASKGAMNALTREWALEFKDKGIRVNTVIPAEVMTPQYETWLKTLDDKEKTMEQRSKRIPLEGRFTTASEIADMVCFLASDRSSHTTGQIIHVDGGYVHLDRACTSD